MTGPSVSGLVPAAGLVLLEQAPRRPPSGRTLAARDPWERVGQCGRRRGPVLLRRGGAVWRPRYRCGSSRCPSCAAAHRSAALAPALLDCELSGTGPVGLALVTVTRPRCRSFEEAEAFRRDLRAWLDELEEAGVYDAAAWVFEGTAGRADAAAVPCPCPCRRPFGAGGSWADIRCARGEGHRRCDVCGERADVQELPLLARAPHLHAHVVLRLRRPLWWGADGDARQGARYAVGASLRARGYGVNVAPTPADPRRAVRYVTKGLRYLAKGGKGDPLDVGGSVDRDRLAHRVAMGLLGGRTVGTRGRWRGWAVRSATVGQTAHIVAPGRVDVPAEAAGLPTSQVLDNFGPEVAAVGAPERPPEGRAAVVLLVEVRDGFDVPEAIAEGLGLSLNRGVISTKPGERRATPHVAGASLARGELPTGGVELPVGGARLGWVLDEEGRPHDVLTSPAYPDWCRALPRPAWWAGTLWRPPPRVSALTHPAGPG